LTYGTKEYVGNDGKSRIHFPNDKNLHTAFKSKECHRALKQYFTTENLKECFLKRK
jgi:hypothetical protein